MGYYNPYTQVADFNFGIDPKGIQQRFNTRLATETAARKAAMQPQGRGLDWASAAIGAAGQIAGSMGGATNNPYDFSTESLGPLTGAAQGFAQAGPVGAVIGGLTGVFRRRQSYKRAQDNVDAIDPNVDINGIDPMTGQPTFNSSAAIQATGTMNVLGKASRKRKRGLFRTGDDSVLAHQMDVKSGMIAENLQSGRDQFNKSMDAYNQQQLAMAQYNQLLNNNNRLKNLYSIGTKLY